MRIRISNPLFGLFLLFLILFLPQCITVPVSYETAETRKEKRAGISAQYGEGRYTGLCEGPKYNYKYGGIRLDYGNSKKYYDWLEAGYEIGSSINGFYETSESDPDYKHEAVMLQIDGRLTAKIVTPTRPARIGIKLAPGLLTYGSISRINGQYEIGGEIGSLTYGSVLLGIGNPEFLTIGYSCYPYFYFIPPYYSFFTLTYHHRKYSITAGGLFKFGKAEDEIPKFHYLMGLGIHY